MTPSLKVPSARALWRKARRVAFPSFPEHLEDEFHKRYNESSAPIGRSGLLMGVFILLLFYLWDRVVDPAQSMQTLLIRSGVAAWMLAVVCLPEGIRVKYFQELTAITITLGGIGVVFIIAIVNNGMMIGLSGVMIVLTFNYGFLRLLFLPSVASGAITCVAYNVAAITIGMDPLFIVANNFFLISTSVAGASITYLLERLFRNQFLAEEALRERQEALARQAQSDARYLAWLRQLAQFLRHEVRHPVAQINSSIEIAQLTSRNDDRIAPHLANAALSSQQVWNLIERASQATDAEAFVRQAHPTRTDVGQLLAEQVKAFRQSNVGIDFHLNDQGSAVGYLDPTQLKEAIANLLDNAASFANDGTRVEVGLRVESGQAIVEVSNKGPLLSKDPESLFGPFVSARSVARGDHQGLGLYLVRLIAEQHGGTAAIANREDGMGVVASISLPLRPGVMIEKSA